MGIIHLEKEARKETQIKVHYLVQNLPPLGVASRQCHQFKRKIDKSHWKLRKKYYFTITQKMIQDEYSNDRCKCRNNE